MGVVGLAVAVATTMVTGVCAGVAVRVHRTLMALLTAMVKVGELTKAWVTHLPLRPEDVDIRARPTATTTTTTTTTTTVIAKATTTHFLVMATAAARVPRGAKAGACLRRRRSSPVDTP
jgi:hypothetical protein